MKYSKIGFFGAIAIIALSGVVNAQTSATKPATKPSSVASVPVWKVTPRQSIINWATTWAGQNVTGRFNSFDADIKFSPTNLPASSVTVSIPANGFNSASGEARENLPMADWLNTRAFPTIKFESNSFTKTASDAYIANGFLTVKGVKYRLALPFRLQNTGPNSVTMTSQVTLDRLNLKIGVDSDEKAEWVARNVQININLNATK